MLLPIAVCALAVLALLVAQWRNSRPGVWLAKPLASTAFVAAAVLWGATDSSFGRWLLGALALCWLGDVLLIPKQRPGCFIAGITSFLLAHLVFVAAFVERSVDAVAVAFGGVLMAPVVWLLLRWLRPHLSGPFRVAVPVYVVAICAMLVAALASVRAAGQPAILLGACLFTVSDVAVARDRFVSPGRGSWIWGLPLYYAGQLVLASTVR